MSDYFPCHECGDAFSTRVDLEDHWREWGHGPEQVQFDAIDKARHSLMGEAAPDPVNAYARDAVVQRRRLRIVR